jgi:hypothetical protein
MDEENRAGAAPYELQERLEHLLAEARHTKEWAPRLGVPFLGFLMTMVEDEVVNQIRTIFGDRLVP